MLVTSIFCLSHTVFKVAKHGLLSTEPDLLKIHEPLLKSRFETLDEMEQFLVQTRSPVSHTIHTVLQLEKNFIFHVQ